MIHEAVRAEKSHAAELSDAERAEADDIIFAYLEGVGGSIPASEDKTGLISSLVSGVRDTLRAGLTRRDENDSSAQAH